MNDITNDAYGIPEKETYNALKRKLHPGVFGLFKKAISAEKARKTKELSLHEDKIGNLDFLRYFPNLESLILSSPELGNISGLRYAPKLTCVNLFSNWPKEMDLAPLALCHELEEIDLTPGFTNFTRETYKTSTVRVYGLEALGKLRKVKYLSLPGMGIEDIGGIADIASLEDVDLSYNPIKDLTPLTALKHINELDLTGCGLQDITPLGQIEGLERLQLEANQITDFAPLLNLKKLKELNAEDNGLAESAIAKWEEAFSTVKEAYFG